MDDAEYLVLDHLTHRVRERDRHGERQTFRNGHNDERDAEHERVNHVLEGAPVEELVLSCVDSQFAGTEIEMKM
jgi:hypothetical protein